MSRVLVTGSLLLALLCSAPVHSSGWKVYKFAEIGVAGTDNFGLRENDRADELIGVVKPSVELFFAGNRFESEVMAGVDFYRFDDAKYEVFDPGLWLSTTGTLIDNLLYVQSNLRVGKSFPEDDFFELDEDTEPNARFIFSPFIATELGRAADLYIGYGHESTDYETDGTVDIQQDVIEFSIGRKPKYGGLLWGVEGDYREDRVGGGYADYTSATASLGVLVGQTVLLRALGGVETNDYSETDNDDSLWEASLKWTPSERTSFTIGYADRFFGGGPTFSMQHRLRLSTFSATLTRNITTSEPVLDTVTAFTDGAANTSLPVGSPTLINDNETIGESDPFIQRQLSIAYKLAGRRSDMIVDAVYSMQNQLNGPDEINSLLGRIVFDRHLSPLTTFRVQYDHRISESDERSLLNYDENRLALKFMYNFDRKERGSILEK